MVTLTCPLCCTETFSTPAALKSHILELLDNLSCLECGEKFARVSELAEHLDECTGAEKEETLEESILARALMRKDAEEEQAEYYCQTCNVHFNDIEEHLRQFHEGQEFLLAEEEAVPDQLDPLVVLLDQSQQAASQTPPTAKKTLPIKAMDIKDKDGRLYTRKFVKIDKFWLEDKNPAAEGDSKKVIEVTLCATCDRYYPGDHACGKEENTLTCDICNTSFSTMKSLRLHKRMHEPIKQREIEAPANYEQGEESVRQMFVCLVCHKTYDKEYESVHMASHEDDDGHNCDVCNRKFFTQSNLEMHMKAHSNNKKFTCSYCKKLFVTYDSLNDHLSNQCQKRPYACQYCGRRFTRPHEKVKHERIHTGEKPHVCDICGKSFRVSYCLTLHMRTHSGTRPYQCFTCGKRFKSHSVYNHHLRTHSDVRAYKCPYCPKAFKTSVQLAGHKNSHIKPFTCTECNRPFASLYAVRAHMETHKRDNNLKYECWMCGALYSRAFALRDHLKQQHQQVEEAEKADAEEMEAASSILVNGEDIILGLDEAESIEIIEEEAE